MPCKECSSTAENWMCLCCHTVLCGRYVMEHMMFHNLETSHPLALSFSDLSVWCYPCESYIDNSQLHIYKNLAHRHKFGEDMQWSYEDDIQQQHKNLSTDTDTDTDSEDESESSRHQQQKEQHNLYVQLHFDSNN